MSVSGVRFARGAGAYWVCPFYSNWKAKATLYSLDSIFWYINFRMSFYARQSYTEGWTVVWLEPVLPVLNSTILSRSDSWVCVCPRLSFMATIGPVFFHKSRAILGLLLFLSLPPFWLVSFCQHVFHQCMRWCTTELGQGRWSDNLLSTPHSPPSTIPTLLPQIQCLTFTFLYITCLVVNCSSGKTVVCLCLDTQPQSPLCPHYL